MTDIPMCLICGHPQADHGTQGCEALGRVPFPDGPDPDCSCPMKYKVGKVDVSPEAFEALRKPPPWKVLGRSFNEWRESR